MRRRSATTGLIVEASYVIHGMVGVLSDSKCGVAMHASGTDARAVALPRTKAVILRSELVIWPLRLVSKTRLEMISGRQE